MDFKRAAASLVMLTTFAVSVPACGVATAESPAQEQAAALSLTAQDTGSADGDEMLGDLTPMDVVKDLGFSLVKSIVGGILSSEVNSFLFPNKTYDMEALLQGVDKTVRKAIFDEAMGGKQDMLDTLELTLNRIDIKRTKCKDHCPDRNELRDDAKATAEKFDHLRATLGPRAQRADAQKFRDAGLRLYMTSVQMDLNRLAMQRELVPEKGGGDVLDMKSDLDEAIPYVRQMVETARSRALLDRMNHISGCEITGHKEGGHFSRETWYTAFNDNGSYGSQAEEKEDALARCEGVRQQHMLEVARDKTARLEVDYAFEMGIIDGWYAVQTALDKLHAVDSPKPVGVDFGGMYGYAWQKTYPNPATGAVSCPAGYTGTTVRGRVNWDYDLVICTRPSQPGNEPALDFGGMYGVLDYHDDGAGWWNNPITGSNSCPAGYTASQMLGNPKSNDDLPVYLCSKPHVKGTVADWEFGGAFSGWKLEDGAYGNPANKQTKDGKEFNEVGCTPGFVPANAGGSYTDSALTYCFRSNHRPATGMTLDQENQARYRLGQSMSQGLINSACLNVIQAFMGNYTQHTSDVCSAADGAMMDAMKLPGVCWMPTGATDDDARSKALSEGPYAAFRSILGCDPIK
jgi:hypothetical protein